MDCRRRHCPNCRLGLGSRIPSGPAVPTDCNSRPDRRLQPIKTPKYQIELATREPSTDDGPVGFGRCIAGLCRDYQLLATTVANIHNRLRRARIFAIGSFIASSSNKCCCASRAPHICPDHDVPALCSAPAQLLVTRTPDAELFSCEKLCLQIGCIAACLRRWFSLRG
jgi:hypothetical protein